MTIEDYASAVLLWTRTEGVRLRDADSRAGIEKYLARNPGLSFIAESDGMLVGTIMSGHDGRRGYIQHLSILDTYRRRGIGSRLVALCLEALKKEGIFKSHLMILADNDSAKLFWSRLGWIGRRDIDLYSFINNESANT